MSGVNIVASIVIVATVVVVITPTIGVAQICGSAKAFNVSWWEFQPFTSKDSAEKHKAGAFDMHTMVRNMMAQCCGKGVEVLIDSPYDTVRHMEEDLTSQTFAYPMTRTSHMEYLEANLKKVSFLPIMETPGSYLLVHLSSSSTGLVIRSILATWPLLVIVVSSASIAGIVIWLLDRTFNPEFPKSFLNGFWEGMWWAYVTMTTVGYGDKTPRSSPARVFGFCWILVGIVIMSVFTAALTTSLGAESAPQGMRGHTIGVLDGSEEFHFAYQHGAVPIVYNTTEALITDLEGSEKVKKLDGILLDVFMTLHLLSDSTTKLEENNIKIDHLVERPAVHGILVQNMGEEAIDCFTRYILKNRHRITQHAVENTGQLQNRKGIEGPETSQKLLAENLIMCYILLAVLGSLIVIFLLWEFLYWRPKARRTTEAEDSSSPPTEINSISDSKTNSVNHLPLKTQ